MVTEESNSEISKESPSEREGWVSKKRTEGKDLGYEPGGFYPALMLVDFIKGRLKDEIAAEVEAGLEANSLTLEIYDSLIANPNIMEKNAQRDYESQQRGAKKFGFPLLTYHIHRHKYLKPEFLNRDFVAEEAQLPFNVRKRQIKEFNKENFPNLGSPEMN